MIYRQRTTTVNFQTKVVNLSRILSLYERSLWEFFLGKIVSKKVEKITLVVGIGASAGGLRALKTFFAHFAKQDRKVDISFVLMQHLDDSGRAIAHEVLTQIAGLPVFEIQNGKKLQPGRVYHAEPHTNIELDGNTFRTSPAKNRQEQFITIDSFFRSLAADRQFPAVGIILSGDGADGALGIKSISDAGGMTMVQTPDSADFPSMPKNAAASGVVDHILNPEEMPKELINYFDYLKGLVENKTLSAFHRQIGSVLGEICEILHKATGHDFKHYKTSTLIRRIQRRMQVSQLSSVDGYLTILRDEPREIDALFKELLINVTSFFRDPEAFETLQRDVLSKAIEGRSKDQKYRVWIAGCSTGEEAYTIGILILEILESRLDSQSARPEIQILATDIDEQALSIARKGSYPATIGSVVSKERLQKYFVKKSGRYHVTKDLRELVLFSAHNLINDPPYSQLDLVSCRNLMIYLGSHLQKKLIPVFHYSLRSGGCLFLGNSESLTDHKDLFKTISTKFRIALRKATAISAPGFQPSTLSAHSLSPIESARNHENDLHLIGQRIVLDEFSPRYAIVNEESQIVSISSGMGKYLDPSSGTFHNNLLKLVKASLRAGLRATFNEAKKMKRKTTFEDASLKVDDATQRIGITVQPMPQLGDDSELYMVIFHYFGTIPSVEVEAHRAGDHAPDAAAFDQLERELETVRNELDRTVQDLEASNEELKSSNEELLSMNEELQSANEELESSKEEVQRANDSLQTINNDLENLLDSTEIATVFLDDKLTIKSFTPSIKTIYNLASGDTGRPIGHFTHLAKQMPEYPPAQSLRGSKTALEDDIEMADGRWILRRLLPYRTTEGNHDGVVATFIDVTHLRTAELQYRQLADSMPLIVWTASPDGALDYYNARWYEVTGLDPKVKGDSSWAPVIHPDDLQICHDHWYRSVRDGIPYEIEFRTKQLNGSYRWYMGRAVPARNSNGVLVKWYGTAIDIHDRVMAEEKRRESEKRFQIMADTAPVMIWMSNVGHDFIWVNKGWLNYTGGQISDQVGEGWIKNLHRDDREPILKAYHTAIDARESLLLEFRLRGKNGEFRWFNTTAVPRYTDKGHFEGYIGASMDITERKMASERLKENAQRLHLMFDTSPSFMCVFAGPDLIFERANPQFYWTIGHREIIGKPLLVALPEVAGQGFFELLRGVHDTGETRVGREVPISLARQNEEPEQRYVDFVYQLDPSHDSPLRRVFVHGNDVTEKVVARQRIEESSRGLREASEALRIAKDEADRARQTAELANESKTLFLANMSHEIRTPLAAILGFSELLEGRTKPTDPDAALHLSRISRNANQLGKLIDELLDLSKIEAEKLEIETSDFELATAVEDVFSVISLKADEKSIKLNRSISPSVGDFVNTDQSRFRQILTNILGNAVKFTESGEVLVHVEVTERNTKHYLVTRVRDTGIGLSMEQRSKLFQTFSQGDASVTRKYGGTGLGLVLSRRLARLMGGDLVLEESQLGEGSTFMFEIEIAPPRVASATTIHQSASPDAVPRLDGVSLLVVDDSVDNQMILQLYLSAVGAKIELANNGLEAVEMMKTKAYDLVLMDIQMPVLDGYQALATATANGYRGPIVALTAHAFKEERDRCVAAGFTDYASKPIDRIALIRKIAALTSVQSDLVLI